MAAANWGMYRSLRGMCQPPSRERPPDRLWGGFGIRQALTAICFAVSVDFLVEMGKLARTNPLHQLFQQLRSFRFGQRLSTALMPRATPRWDLPQPEGRVGLSTGTGCSRYPTTSVRRTLTATTAPVARQREALPLMPPEIWAHGFPTKPLDS
jgi:hypothetical protein